MKKLQYWIRNYFGFSQRETNGFVVLFLLLITILFIPSFVNQFYPATNSYIQDKKALDSVIAELKRDSTESKSTDYFKSSKGKHTKPIDPNTASIEQLETLFGNKIAQTIDNYRKKGGRFRIKSDLKKVYGINEKLYASCSPFIALPEELFNNVKATKLKDEKAFIDMNKADSIQWEKLQGIGPVLASRIIKYRTKLGGFVDQTQLLEVYGIKQEVYAIIKDQLRIEKNYLPLQISLNLATYQELRNHPYLGGKIASAILKYRKANKSINSIQELVNASIITEEVAKKLTPYIVF